MEKERKEDQRDMETVYNLNSRGMGHHKQQHSVSRRAVIMYASVHTHTKTQTHLGTLNDEALKVNVCNWFSWLEAASQGILK